MHIQNNNLRLYRKQSSLTQSDVAFIMKLADFANISRWEQGHRKPTIEMLIIYHILFKIPIESLFARQKHALSEVLGKRIEILLEALKDIPTDSKVISRIAFLESALSRLNA